MPISFVMVVSSQSIRPHPLSIQCPLTFSLVEFPYYWDWLWYPGLPHALSVHRRLPSVSIFRYFYIHSSSLAIEFHSCFFFTTDVSAPYLSTFHLFAFYVSFQAWV